MAMDQVVVAATSFSRGVDRDQLHPQTPIYNALRMHAGMHCMKRPEGGLGTWNLDAGTFLKLSRSGFIVSLFTAHGPSLYKPTHIRTRVFAHAYSHTRLHTRVFTHASSHTHLHTRMFTYACSYTRLHTRMFTHAYSHTHCAQPIALAVYRPIGLSYDEFIPSLRSSRQYETSCSLL